MSTPGDPDEALRVLLRDLAQGVENTADILVVFGPAAEVGGLRERAAEDRDDRVRGAVEMLEEQDLELDRMLHRVAVVLEGLRTRGRGQPRHEPVVDRGLAQRRAERLLGEAEALGRPVMRLCPG
jgi:hypothetical protein